MTRSSTVQAWERLRELIGDLGADFVRDGTVVEVPCNRPPWVSTRLALEPGDQVTALAFGSTQLTGTYFAPAVVSALVPHR